MKPTEITDDSIARPTVWSAPLKDIPPGHCAKFRIFWCNHIVEAFVVNFGGHYHAYVNYCVHAGTPLDWWPNEFFDNDRQFLKCGTHGSLFEPDTGKCAGGPCAGGSLLRLPVEVIGRRIFVRSNCDTSKGRADPG
jgi:nitrite reductase/ring-hydroxylating ferredoxin subunit